MKKPISKPKKAKKTTFTKTVWNRPSKEELHKVAEERFHFDKSMRNREDNAEDAPEQKSRYKESLDEYNATARYVFEHEQLMSALGGKAEEIHHIKARFVFPDGVNDPRNHVPLMASQHRKVTDHLIECEVREDGLVYFTGEMTAVWNPAQYIALWDEARTALGLSGN